MNLSITPPLAVIACSASERNELRSDATCDGSIASEMAVNPRMSAKRTQTFWRTPLRRGIGLAIALRAARDGANVAIAAKTAEPHPKLKGTIFTAADEVRAVGGKALPVICDIRDEAQVIAAVDKTVAEFGAIDICVNNASAISLTNSQATDMKRFDLMMGINTRGTFMVSKYCIPHLKKAENPHILMLSPPLDMKAKWFEQSTAYTMRSSA